MKKYIPFLTLVIAAPTMGLADDVADLQGDIADKKELIAEVNEEISEISGRLEKIQSETTRIEALEASISEMSEVEKEATEKLLEVEQELKNATLLLARYQAQYQPQTNFKAGELLGPVTDKQGRSYQGVTIKEVSKDSLRVAHSGGFAVIPFTDLPAQFDNRYKMPPAVEGSNVAATVFASRPESLATAEKKVKKSSTSKSTVTKEELVKTAMDTRKNERAELLAKRDKEREEIIARNALRTEVSQKTVNINREISALTKSITQFNYQKRDFLKSLNSRNVRPSPARIEKELEPISRKIAGAEAQIALKRKELRELADSLNK